MDAQIKMLVEDLSNLSKIRKRVIVGVAGPPASGKSTTTTYVNDQLNKLAHVRSCVVPMDGFHLDNEVLLKNGDLEYKGSPATFDFAGFSDLVDKITANNGDITYPEFNRERDKSISDSGIVKSSHNIVIFEGNYLLLNIAPWRTLADKFDRTVFFDVPIETLRKRLMERWSYYGYSETDALRKIEKNDLPNSELVLNLRLPSDFNINPKPVGMAEYLA